MQKNTERQTGTHPHARRVVYPIFMGTAVLVFPRLSDLTLCIYASGCLFVSFKVILIVFKIFIM